MANEGANVPDSFQWAVKNGDIDQVKAILNKQPDLVNEVMEGRCALHYASDYGQKDVVEFLVGCGANVNQPDKYGITPLLSAIFEGHTSTVELLLKKRKMLISPPRKTYKKIDLKPLQGANKNATFDGKCCLEHAETDDIKGLLKK